MRASRSWSRIRKGTGGVSARRRRQGRSEQPDSCGRGERETSGGVTTVSPRARVAYPTEQVAKRSLWVARRGIAETPPAIPEFRCTKRGVYPPEAPRLP